MKADIKKATNGYLATFERPMNHTVEAVWTMLTDNEQLKKWFQELSVGELCEGGFMKFYMPDVIEQALEISEFRSLSVLEFDWFGDTIRFELHAKQNGCVLVLKEKLRAITEQTKKDIAGWHVCLDVIEALLDGKTIQREDEWKKWFDIYTEEIDTLNRLDS